MTAISPVTSDNFSLSAAGIGIVGAVVVGGLLVNYIGCRNATKNMHDTEICQPKSTKNPKGMARAMYRFSAPIYAMLMFVLSAIVTLTMYIFRITGLLTITTAAGDLVDVNVWIAIAVGAGLYVLSARWIIASKWVQVIVATLAAVGSPLLLMTAELLHAEALFLRVLLVIASGLLAVVAILALLWPLNHIFKTQSRQKARSGSMRANYMMLGALAYFIIWFVAISGAIFNLEWVSYFYRAVIQLVIISVVHLWFLFQFVAYLFRKADEHADPSTTRRSGRGRV